MTNFKVTGQCPIDKCQVPYFIVLTQRILIVKQFMSWQISMSQDLVPLTRIPTHPSSMLISGWSLRTGLRRLLVSVPTRGNHGVDVQQSACGVRRERSSTPGHLAAPDPNNRRSSRGFRHSHSVCHPHQIRTESTLEKSVYGMPSPIYLPQDITMHKL